MKKKSSKSNWSLAKERQKSSWRVVRMNRLRKVVGSITPELAAPETSDKPSGRLRMLNGGGKMTEKQFKLRNRKEQMKKQSRKQNRGK